jgi:aldose 1-epimerase
MTNLVTDLETVLLTNDNGMLVEVINFGGRIKSIKFPVNSKSTEMILGYASAQEYLSDEFYLGATCGRVCNRIAGGKFELAGRQYQLPLNDGMNCLHGGDNNFSLRIWQMDKQTLTQSSVTLSLVSDDGDQGFPGTLSVSVTYELSEDNKLNIQYSANTDLATPVNLTNHAYFNLGEKDNQSLYLQIKSSAYLESNSENLHRKLVKKQKTQRSVLQMLRTESVLVSRVSAIEIWRIAYGDLLQKNKR